MDETLDPAILAAPHGKGSWSSGYKVDIEVDGEESEYFLKIVSVLRSLQIEKYLPNNVASPLAYGTLELDSSSSFFLTPFRYLSEKAVDPQPLAEVLDKLHKSSFSPTGEEYFSRQLKADIQWLHDVRGLDPEFDEVAEQFIEKVIPRLLRPLQSGGRNIKPTLVHGDVWPGNLQLDTNTRRVILYESCCYYGHKAIHCYHTAGLANGK
ncbi:Fructosamine/Ketosamine-3-kinase [Xylaria sp. FL0064]|nr:Fructosamine/Ketosamine-3-kinase [Xylaria sp. FL0064]